MAATRDLDGVANFFSRFFDLDQGVELPSLEQIKRTGNIDIQLKLPGYPMVGRRKNNSNSMANPPSLHHLFDELLLMREMDPRNISRTADDEEEDKSQSGYSEEVSDQEVGMTVSASHEGDEEDDSNDSSSYSCDNNEDSASSDNDDAELANIAISNLDSVSRAQPDSEPHRKRAAGVGAEDVVCAGDNAGKTEPELSSVEVNIITVPRSLFYRKYKDQDGMAFCVVAVFFYCIEVV
ncbi:unnamed protein product [Protopolystoma xenopodis]|uniref:Uncharacterized protein n=1 Tax=Protopolystoma xenopodis TaxID=117903 RepID=A0A448WEQ9_9PLAT|nr:unnamed protein product [Protopolystoma xenopodis]